MASVGSSKFVRLAAAGLIFLLTMAFLIAMIVAKPVERLMHRQIEIRLGRALGAAVHIGGIETNLVTRVQVRDVYVTHRDGTQLLNLKYGRMNYHIWDLFRRDVSIHTLRIDSLFIAVTRDSTGLLSPLSIHRDTRDTLISSSLKIHVQNLDIRHAMISYNDRQIPLQCVINGIGFEYRQNDPDVYHWVISSDSVRFMLQGNHLAVTKLNAAGMINPEYWEVRSLVMITPHLVLSGHAHGDRLTRYSKIRGEISLQGQIGGITDFFRESVPQSLFPAYGGLDLTLTLEGRWNHPQFAGEVLIRNARLGNIIIPSGQIRMMLRDSLFTLDHMDLTMLGGRILGDGYIALDSLMDHRLSLNVEEVDFLDFLKTLNQDSIFMGGLVRGRWTSSGPVKSSDKVRVETYLNLTHARYAGKTLPDLNMRLSVEADTGELILLQGENRFQGNLKLNGRGGEGNFRFDIHRIESLAKLMNIDDFTGSFRGSGRIKGKFKNPEVSLDIRGETLRFQHFPMDSLRVSAEYRNGQLIFQNGAFSGQYDSRELLLPLFNSTLFRGSFSYRGIFSGPADNPLCKIQAKLFEPEFGDVCFDEGDLNLYTLQDQIHLDALTLRKDSLCVMAMGQYRMIQKEGRIEVSIFEDSDKRHPPFTETEVGPEKAVGSSRFGLITISFDQAPDKVPSLKAHGMNIHLDKMQTLYRGSTNWRGTCGFKLALSDWNHDSQGQLLVWADSVGTDQAVLDSIRGKVELRENRITAAPLEFYTGGRKSSAEADFRLTRTVSGKYKLTENSEIRGRAEGKGIDLSYLTPLLGLGIELSGVSEYRLEWRGLWGRPRVKGHLNVRDGQIRLKPGTDPIEFTEASLSLSDSVQKIGPISGKIRNIPFRMEGNVISRDWRTFQMDAWLAISGSESIVMAGSKTTDSLDLRIDISNLNLSLFDDLLPDVLRIHGRVNSRIDVYGPLESPQLIGFMELQNMAYHPPGLDQPFTDGLVKATFKDQNIILDTLFFKINGGTVQAGGKTKFSGGEITILDAWLAVDNVQLNRAKAFSLAVQSVRAGIEKKRDGFYLNGDAILGECRIVKDIQPGDLLPFFQKVERPITAPPAIFQKMHIDLRLLDSDKLWIDNNMAHLRLHSELGFTGRLAQPNLSGRLSVEEGYVLYMDRKFQVKQGVLDFVDPHRINPIVAFHAQADIKRYQTWSRHPYTVSLNIQGSLDQANITLSSSPPLERSDIITLLTVGATREELTRRDEEGKSSLGIVLEDRIGHLSSRRISGFASRRIGRLLGLQDMTIDGNLFRFGKSWGPQLLASKGITDRMELSYTTRVGHANDQSIRLDYRLSKILSIEGQTDQQGRSGIDLKFRWKFK